jgi:hypothetical protein
MNVCVMMGIKPRPGRGVWMYFFLGAGADKVNGSSDNEEKGDDDVFVFCGVHLVQWCRFAGVMQLIMCVAMGVLFLLQELEQIHPSRLVTPLTRSVGVWVGDGVGASIHVVRLGNSTRLADGCSLASSSWRAARDSYRVEQMVLSFGSLDTRILLVVFYGLSGVFQLWGSMDRRFYYDPLRDGCNHVSRFVEYSISASLMVLVICAQLGMTDFYSLIGAVSNMWCCMVFWLLAELLHHEEMDKNPAHSRTVEVGYLGFHVPYYLIAYLAGWVALFVASTMVISNLINFEACVERQNSDAFRIVGQVAAYFEIILFVCFGCAQSVGLFIKPGRPGSSSGQENTELLNTLRAWWSSVIEFACIFLGLTANVGLGIMVYTASLI